MVIRLATYHARPGKDAEGWQRSTAATARGIQGMRQVEFVRSVEDPLQYGVLMFFDTQADLDAYKASDTYRDLVQSLQETWADNSKPATEQVFESLDF